MRFRSLVVLAVAFVLSAGAYAGWPRHDMNRDGIINFADLTQAVQSGDYQLVNMVLSHWGQNVLTTPTGAPNAPGADAKAIARWNMVPWQTMTGEFNVGVVAFHINGISAVSFSVNGAEWIDVTDKTLNPESGTYEYWIRVDASDYADGEVEIRAVAFPVNGLPRVLMGAIESATIKNGEHSIFLSMNAGGTLPSSVRYVSGNGSDETGNGSLNNPFRTPYFALQSIQRAAGNSVADACDGAIIYCLPGEYEWGRAESPYPRTARRWATITTAPGVSRDEVVFTALGPNGFTTRLIAARNIRTGGNMLFRSAGSEKFLWVSECDVVGAGRVNDRSPLNGHVWTGVWVTDSSVRDVRDAVQHATLARNVHVNRISCDAFSMSRLVVNSTVHDIDSSGTDFHPDVYQFKGSENIDNHIVYGLRATAIRAQGIFARGSERVDNIAFVNALLERCPTLESSGRASQWMDVATNHLLLIGVSKPNYTFAWRTSDLRNILVRGSVFHKMSTGSTSSGGTAVISDSWFRNNHFIDTTSYGARVAGLDATTGDPGFVSADTADYRPSSASPLLRRLPPLMPVDAAQHVRPPLASVGAFEH